MTTPRIEEMVERCLPKSGDLQKVGDHYWGGDYEPTYYELINLEASFREILKPKLRKAITEAHQAGIDEVIEIIEENRQDPDNALSRDDEIVQLGYNQALDDTIKSLQDNK